MLKIERINSLGAQLFPNLLLSLFLQQIIRFNFIFSLFLPHTFRISFSRRQFKLKHGNFSKVSHHRILFFNYYSNQFWKQNTRLFRFNETFYFSAEKPKCHINTNNKIVALELPSAFNIVKHYKYPLLYYNYTYI